MNSVNNQTIRCFDLGGGGLKTALVNYDAENKTMNVGTIHKMGKCPDQQDISDWARQKIKEFNSDLDAEVQNNYAFGFSLAGLDKLRSKPLSTWDVPDLFGLPREKVTQLHDGNAHLLASLRTMPNLPEGRVWNIALGTGVGFGFTNSKKELKPTEDLMKFFGREAWEVKELTTNKGIWEVGSGPAFDKIMQKHGDKTKAIEEFAGRWKLFIEKHMIENGKDWGIPNSVVFTGGHTEWNGDLLTNAINSLHLKVPTFTGPKEAGILGAAYQSVEGFKI
ncbi:MAG: hypothetical protein H0V82_00420 [Candidatus Protochlamydia sp.]|nr:hypothetical protein [Candidatus Protochlamydia sp.]